MRFKLEIDLDDNEIETDGIDNILPGYLRSAATQIEAGQADAGTVRGHSSGKWRTFDGTLVRDRAVAMIPVPQFSVPGEQLYVSIVETGSPSRPEWVVGTSRWNDTEWDGGVYTSTLSRAMRFAADRVDRLSN